MNCPDTSSTTAAVGICTLPAGPNALIFPFSITSVPFGIGADVTGTIVPPRSRIGCCRPGLFGMVGCARSGRQNSASASTAATRCACRFVALLPASRRAGILPASRGRAGRPLSSAKVPEGRMRWTVWLRIFLLLPALVLLRFVRFFLQSLVLLALERVALLQVFRDALKREKDEDRKSTRLNSSHVEISYAVFCLKK